MAQTHLYDNLLCHYDFNGNTTDKSENSSDATNFGASLTSDHNANLNRAFSFDGVNGYVDLPKFDELASNAFPVTFSLWLNLNSTSSTQRVFTTSARSTGYSGFFMSVTSGQVSMHYGNHETFQGTQSRNSGTGSTILAPNTWYHLVVIVRGQNNMEMYIDGVPETLAYSGTAPGVSHFGGTGEIGRTLNAGEYFDGSVDEFRIWNRALSVTEADQVYKIDQASSNLVLHLDLNGDALDNSVDANNGAVVGAEVATDRFGNLGGAYYFDGVDDYIDITNGGSLKPSLPITISYWVNSTDMSSNDNRMFANDNHVSTYYGVVSNISANNVSFSTGSGIGAGATSRRTGNGTTTTLQNDTWHHVVGVIRTATDMSIYVDSVEQTVTYSGSGGNMVYTSSNGSAGTFDRSTGTQFFFNGAIDDLRMWDEALVEEEVYALYTPGVTDEITTLSESLASELRLDIDLNEVAHDASTFANTLTTSGTELATNRKEELGNAFYFDGIDDEIEIENDPSFKPSFPISVSYWVYLEDSSLNNTVFSTNDLASAYTGVWGQIVAGKVRINFGNNTSVGTSGRHTAEGTSILNSHEWYHVVCTVNGYLDMDVYVNGVKETVIYSGAAPTLVYNSANGLIGGRSTNAGHVYFNGAIDDFKLWGKEVSATEVNALYDPGFATELVTMTEALEDELRLSISLDGDANDDSPYENDGVLNGPFMAYDRHGITDMAYYFDGVDDNIEIPYDVSFQPSFPMTVSAWVYVSDSTDAGQIFFANDADASKYSGIWMGIGLDGKINLNTGNGAGAGVWERKSGVSSTVITSNQWHHVIGVFNSSTNFEMYLDGAVETLTYTGNGGGMVYLGNSASIGKRPFSPSAHFEGAIDDVKLWARKLTSVEIGALYTPGTNNDPVLAINKPEYAPELIGAYPNPAIDVLHIDASFQKVVISDVIGNVMMETTSNDINLTNLESGLYVLTLEKSTGDVLTQSFIKE